MTQPEPDTPVTAYCAPGQRGVAELLLALRGERYRELVEHPWLAGRTDIILAADPQFPLPADWSWRGETPGP